MLIEWGIMDNNGSNPIGEKSRRYKPEKGEVTHSDTNQRALEIEIAQNNIPSKQKPLIMDMAIVIPLITLEGVKRGVNIEK
jgi:hypothetical protein